MTATFKASSYCRKAPNAVFAKAGSSKKAAYSCPPLFGTKRSGSDGAPHLKGWRNYTNEILCLLTLELMHSLFVDAR